MNLVASLQLHATFFPFLVLHTSSKHLLRLFWSLLLDFLCVILLYFLIIGNFPEILGNFNLIFWRSKMCYSFLSFSQKNIFFSYFFWNHKKEKEKTHFYVFFRSKLHWKIYQRRKREKCFFIFHSMFFEKHNFSSAL